MRKKETNKLMTFCCWKETDTRLSSWQEECGTQKRVVWLIVPRTRMVVEDTCRLSFALGQAHASVCIFHVISLFCHVPSCDMATPDRQWRQVELFLPAIGWKSETQATQHPHQWLLHCWTDAMMHCVELALFVFVCVFLLR